MTGLNQSMGSQPLLIAGYPTAMEVLYGDGILCCSHKTFFWGGEGVSAPTF